MKKTSTEGKQVRRVKREKVQSQKNAQLVWPLYHTLYLDICDSIHFYYDSQERDNCRFPIERRGATSPVKVGSMSPRIPDYRKIIFSFRFKISHQILPLNCPVRLRRLAVIVASCFANRSSLPSGAKPVDPSFLPFVGLIWPFALD